MAEDKKDEKKETWTNYVALTTVILAVCATLSTFKGGGYSTQAVLSQSRASNKWAHYQSKDIKGYLYELQREKVDLDLKAGDLSPGARAQYEARLAEYTRRIEKYEREKAEISQEARDFEAVIGQAQRHGQSFGLAVIFLQVGILLCSISALMKKKPLWLAGAAVGAVGVAAFADGFLLFLG